MNKLINRNALKLLNSSYHLRRNALESICTTQRSVASLASSSSSSSLVFTAAKQNDMTRRDFHAGFGRLHNKESAAKQIEKTVGTPEKFDFMAETKQLLNIVAKSLYSEKEVFIRELISNSSDALEKLKYAQMTGSLDASTNAEIPFQIEITADDTANTLTIQDTGIGMTRAELITNLGTIAHSGSKAFLEKMTTSDGGSASTKNIIGQFGVGFYSAFMVADKVTVLSQSSQPGEKAYEWTSSGDGSYEITEVEGVQRGTKIVMHLKSDCSEFSKEDTIKKIIRKYSNFVGHPILVNGDRINLIEALWLEDPKNITEEQHEEFYKFIGNPYDKPRYTLQYKTDAPLNIRSLFYIPQYKPNLFDISQEGDIGVSLYSKKVLILSKANQILPRWLRFIKGVVDSEDIPLNLSRELLQDSNLIRKLRKILTKRIIRFLNDESKFDDKKFTEFYEDYKLYFKEAITKSSDQTEKEEIASVLRFETNKTDAGVYTTLDEYIKRMKPDQKNIFYFAAPSRELAITSPYFEAIKQKDYEVVFLFEPHDEVVILQLGQYHNKNLVGIEQEIQGEKNKDDLIIEGDERSLNNAEAQELKEWLKNALSTKVKNVKITTKLETHPCIITTSDMGAIRHFVKTNLIQRDKAQNLFSMIDLSLEINPRNNLIKSLYNLSKKEPELAKDLAQQLLDNALIVAGLVEDPRLVLSNLNKLLEKAFAKY